MDLGQFEAMFDESFDKGDEAVQQVVVRLYPEADICARSCSQPDRRNLTVAFLMYGAMDSFGDW